MSNDTQTMTIAEFLLARIAEDEAVAHQSSDILSGPAQYGRDLWSWGDQRLEITKRRVLAECEVKRQIVAIHASTTPSAEANTWAPGMCSGCGFDGFGDWDRRDDECPTLRALAAVCADHPDYDESWRP